MAGGDVPEFPSQERRLNSYTQIDRFRLFQNHGMVSGPRVQRDQAPSKVPYRIRRSSPGLPLPVGDPTVLEELPRSRAYGLRIKLPYLFTAFRIERDHAIGRRGQIERVVNHSGVDSNGATRCRSVALPKRSASPM